MLVPPRLGPPGSDGPDAAGAPDAPGPTEEPRPAGASEAPGPPDATAVSGSRRAQAEHLPAPGRLSRPHAGQTMAAHCRRGAGLPARGRRSPVPTLLERDHRLEDRVADVDAQEVGPSGDHRLRPEVVHVLVPLGVEPEEIAHVGPGVRQRLLEERPEDGVRNRHDFERRGRGRDRLAGAGGQAELQRDGALLLEYAGAVLVDRLQQPAPGRALVRLSVAVVVEAVAGLGPRSAGDAGLRRAAAARVHGADADAGAARRAPEPLVGLAVAVVVQAVAGLRPRSAGDAGLRLAVGAGVHRAGAGADAARERAEPFVDQVVAIVVLAVADFLAARRMPLVHLAVAVVVQAVAGLRGGDVRRHALHGPARARGRP